MVRTVTLQSPTTGLTGTCCTEAQPEPAESLINWLLDVSLPLNQVVQVYGKKEVGRREKKGSGERKEGNWGEEGREVGREGVGERKEGVW